MLVMDLKNKGCLHCLKKISATSRVWQPQKVEELVNKTRNFMQAFLKLFEIGMLKQCYGREPVMNLIQSSSSLNLLIIFLLGCERLLLKSSIIKTLLLFDYILIRFPCAPNFQCVSCVIVSKQGLLLLIQNMRQQIHLIHTFNTFEKRTFCNMVKSQKPRNKIQGYSGSYV